MCHSLYTKLNQVPFDRFVLVVEDYHCFLQNENVFEVYHHLLATTITQN